VIRDVYFQLELPWFSGAAPGALVSNLFGAEAAGAMLLLLR
jgi:hypothetical protein